MMAVGAERRSGARDRDIGARDNAERAVKRHRQHAAQRGQRPPHVGVLHEISEVFVSGEAEAGGRAIDHGIHRVGKRAAAHRHRDDHEDLHDLFGRGDAEDRTQALRHPGVSRHREDRGKRGARNAQQRNAGGAEYESEPYPRGRAGALVGGNDEPEHQQRRRNGGNADRCGEGLQQQHVGNFTSSDVQMAANSVVCKKSRTRLVVAKRNLKIRAFRAMRRPCRRSCHGPSATPPARPGRSRRRPGMFPAAR